MDTGFTGFLARLCGTNTIGNHRHRTLVGQCQPLGNANANSIFILGLNTGHRVLGYGEA